MNSLVQIPLSKIEEWFNEQILAKKDDEQLESANSVINDFKVTMLTRLSLVQEACLADELPVIGPLTNQDDFEKYMHTRCELAAMEFIQQTSIPSRVNSPYH